MWRPDWWCRAARTVMPMLPIDTAARLTARAADERWQRSAADRRVVAENLSLVLGRPIDEWAIEVRDVFRHFGWYLAEFLCDARWPDTMRAIPGTDELRGHLNAAGGGIVLTAHIGNWELGAISVAGLEGGLAAVALPHADRRMSRFFDAQRRRGGVRTVALGRGGTAEALQVLRQGRWLGVVGDRDFVGDQGVPVELFGRATLMPRGPATLSLRAGVPIVPVFCIRESPWRFRWYSEPPIAPPTRARDGWRDPRSLVEAVSALTQRYAAAIERSIRRFPTQWVVFRSLPSPSASAGPAVGSHASDAGALAAKRSGDACEDVRHFAGL